MQVATAAVHGVVCIWTIDWRHRRRRIWEADGILSVDDRIRLLGEDRPVAEAHFAQDKAYYAELRAARRDGRPLPEPPSRLQR